MKFHKDEDWNISCSISEQGCHSHQLFQPSRSLKKKKKTCDLSAIRLQPLPTRSLKNSRCEKSQGTGPSSWDAYERNDFTEPRLLHLPIKIPNSLTWNIWFSLIHNNLSMFRLPVLCYKLLFNLTPHPPLLVSLEQFSQDYLRCCLPDWSISTE